MMRPSISNRYSFCGSELGPFPAAIFAWIGVVSASLIAPPTAASEPFGNLGQAIEATQDDTPPAPAHAAPLAPAGGAFQATIEISQVVPDQADQPLDRHLVLFKDGKAYDFAMTEPRDVTVIDPVLSQVTLLSREKQVKTTIAHQDIVMAATRVKVFAKKEGIEAQLGINLPPTKIPGDGYKIEFAGYRYDATAALPTEPMQPIRFAEFTDWVARVNLVRKLGSPPFARIALGRTIASDGLVPATITLRIESNGRTRTLKSKYTFENGLSPENETRIEKVAGMIALYQDVALETFPR